MTMTTDNAHIGKRSVFVVVPQWPSGTMAIKFGSALMKALGVDEGDAELIQFAPDRVFRVEADRTEAELDTALRTSGVSWHGSVRLADNCEPQPMSA